ncbi:glycoside hydrolase family 16 protein [Aestuariibaculum sp. M13]|uniref:glycoside hydrolase family 16 protein n=1 Tax=Aestuariibaculum sp. M13 TaxID=2967132 RepID=UPI002159E1BF|nr:glycoside hydrolase family 16 protein [Aestuariibaculum sp. M13]MCR8667850.1 glycoside hydrolase family 16 protein [Aestuariibaculum sp. M13]
MIKKMLYILNIGLWLLLSCSGGSDDLSPPDTPKDIIPTNLTLMVDVLGTDTNNPNGDGSGVITVSIHADNADSYGFKVESQQEVKNTTGVFEYTFINEGTNEYVITAFAYSKTGHEISTFKKVMVYVASNDLQLVWSDEFNTNGVPDASKWGYDIGNGCPDICGWGNGEKQYYTNRSDNVKVENGLLKIIAKKEDYQGSAYTSARLLTKDKYEFTYGRIDVRAKLPSGQGTWPAIWMLGANIDEVGWPECGEIDIMEHWGHNATVVSSATHTLSCSGGCENVKVGETTVTDYATSFHIYSLIWNEDELQFLIDGDLKYTYNPATKNVTTWPYDKPQFLILNVALGGSWFTIDPNFTEAVMEIDYVKVYQ